MTMGAGAGYSGGPGTGGGGVDVTQTDWGIDFTNGSDSNVGTAASPLKTWLKFAQLTGMTAGPWYINAATTLVLTNNQPNTDFAYLDVIIGPSGSLSVNSVGTQNQTGTFTASTNMNPATNTPQDVTDSALGAGNAWTSVLNQIGTITSSGTGGRVGAKFVVVKDLAAKKARLSPIIQYPGADNWTASELSASAVSFTNDGYKIVQPNTINLAYLRIRPGYQSNASKPQLATFTNIFFNGLHVGGQIDILTNGNCVNFYGCQFTECVFSSCSNGTQLVACELDTSNFVIGGNVTMSACAMVFKNSLEPLFIENGGIVLMQNDCIAQGCSLAQLNSAAGSLDNLGMCAFDSHANGIDITQGWVWDFGFYWGTANAGAAVNCHGNGSGYVIAANVPSCNVGLGVGRETIIGGTNKTWAQTPYIEGANGASITNYT